MMTSQRPSMTKRELEDFMAKLSKTPKIKAKVKVSIKPISDTQIEKHYGVAALKKINEARKQYRKTGGTPMNFPNKITKALIAIMMMAATAFASDVSWTRFKGTVKMLDLDKNRVTIQNESSDLITIPVDGNVRIFEGKDQVALDKLKLDDKIMLQYIPINQKLIQQMEQEEKARQKQLQGD